MANTEDLKQPDVNRAKNADPRPNFVYRFFDRLYRAMDKATDAAIAMHPVSGEMAEIDKFLDEHDKKMRSRYPAEFAKIDKEMQKRYE
jgi:hypothetical protein